MQSHVYALCYFCCVKASIQERIYIAAFVCTCQKIVKSPHRQVTTKATKILILNVSLCHRIYLCVRYKQTGYTFLIALWQTLIKTHLAKYLGKLMFCQIAVSKCLHQMDVLCRVVTVEHLQNRTEQVICT